MPTMFPYDPELLAAAAATPKTTADVVAILEAIDALCVNGDGLKWFNLLYMQVTKAVEARVNEPSPADTALMNPAWIAALDVEFAGFYFRAMQSSLRSQPTPGCWQALFNRRNQTELMRIQFALAGVNAHINHDLPQAVLALCVTDQTEPQHGTSNYIDFTALNTTLDGLIKESVHELHVRLLGESVPPISPLDDALAAWSVSAAREAAWDNAELLWRLRSLPPASAATLDSIDAATTVAGEALLLPVL